MTTEDAQRLVAKLFAAYPAHRDADELTAVVYIEHLAKLPEFNTTLAAIDELIRGSRFLPSIAEVRDQYQAIKRREPQPFAIGEAPPTEAERAENLRQARAFAERMNHAVDQEASAA